MMKSGFIGIIGRPNVGKSTLLNSILGEKVAITTDKPQTTRNSIRGIYTRFDDEAVTGTDGVQMVFIDTPGIHKARNKLGEAMTEMAVNTYKEVDVVLFLVDGSMKKGPGDKYILDMIRDLDTPKILVINIKWNRKNTKKFLTSTKRPASLTQSTVLLPLREKMYRSCLQRLKPIWKRGRCFSPKTW